MSVPVLTRRRWYANSTPEPGVGRHDPIRSRQRRIVARMLAKIVVARMSAATIGRSPISRLSAVFPSITTLVVYENRRTSQTEAPRGRV